MFLFADDGVTCWGASEQSPKSLRRPTSVVVVGDHACAIDVNGVVYWGNSAAGKTSVPTGQLKKRSSN